MSKKNDESYSKSTYYMRQLYRQADHSKVTPSEDLYKLSDPFLVEQAEKHITVEPIPERIRRVRTFVELAHDVAEVGRYRMRVIRADTYVTTKFYFFISSPLANMKPLMLVSDEIGIVSVKNNTIIMDFNYYTHKTLIDGRVILPMNEQS